MGDRRYKILLVEDDKLDQTTFKRLVEKEQLPYDYIIAGSVSDAKSILGAQQFDIIISDYNLGDGNAFDILDSVRDTPVVLVTGAGDEEIAVRVWKAGAYDYLTKDIDRNYLKALPITVENTIRHRQAEKKLQLLSGAIMSTDDSVYITDIDDNIIFVNKAFCQTYGYKEEEIIGKPGTILWIGKPESEKTRSVFQTRAIGSSWEVGFYHRHKGGTIFPVSLSRSPIKDPSGCHIATVAIARDISERIGIEDEIRTANLKLERQNQLKSELAIMIAEALKTLLANKDNNRTKRVINDFLDVSRIEAGKMKLELAELNLHSVVLEVIEALSPLAAQKDIELKSFMPDSGLIVKADRNRITQVLSNLINRAIKSISVGGHICIVVRDVGSEIKVQVQDDGPIIQSCEAQRIFDYLAIIKEHIRKQQGQDSTHAKLENPAQDSAPISVELLLTALGLPIAKELVELHGGYLSVETVQGKGNSFCFALPKPASVRKQVSVAAAAASKK